MGELLPPSRPQLAALAKRIRDRTPRLAPASWLARWNALCPPAHMALTRAELLTAYEPSSAAFVVLLAAINEANAPRARQRPLP